MLLAPDNAFRPIVETAYAIFEVDTPEDHQGCECCWEPRVQADFFRHASGDLPLDYVQAWFGAAVPPEVAQDLWRWMLPRILEFLAAGESPSELSIELTLSRFPTGDRSRWTFEEWDVLEAFRRLYIDSAATPSSDALDDILCMFGLAGWPVEDLFDQVFAWPTEQLVVRLYDDWKPRPGRDSIWTTTFWPRASMALEKWRDPALGERFLLFSYEDGVPDELARMSRELAEAIELHAPRQQ